MELSVQKWGNSTAVRLPSELLKLLKVKVGDKLSVNLRPDGVLLKRARPSYSLEDLLAQCDPVAPEPDDLSDWSNMNSVGREAQ
jgi:antitoxin ChpS